MRRCDETFEELLLVATIVLVVVVVVGVVAVVVFPFRDGEDVAVREACVASNVFLLMLFRVLSTAENSLVV